MHSSTEHLCAEQRTLAVSDVGGGDQLFFRCWFLSEKVARVSRILWCRETQTPEFPRHFSVLSFPLIFTVSCVRSLRAGGGRESEQPSCFPRFLPFLLLFPSCSLPSPGLYFILRAWASGWGIALLGLTGSNLFTDLSPCFPGVYLTLLEVPHRVVCRGGQSREARGE